MAHLRIATCALLKVAHAYRHVKNSVCTLGVLLGVNDHRCSIAICTLGVGSVLLGVNDHRRSVCTIRVSMSNCIPY